MALELFRRFREGDEITFLRKLKGLSLTDSMTLYLNMPVSLPSRLLSLMNVLIFLSTVSDAQSGGTEVFGNATAANGTFTNNGGTVSGTGGGFTSFGNATAANGTFTNNGGTVSGAGGGFTSFGSAATAANGTFTNNGGMVSGAGGGVTSFFGGATAGNATLVANGGMGGGQGGTIFFEDKFYRRHITG